jgi:nucleoside-diphosphate-sugar epimerase
MKRVLITGGGGFIGQRCLPLLEALEYEVHAVSRAPRAGKTQRVTWHNADVLEKTAVAELVAHVRPTHLLHLAWYTEHGKFWSAVENLQWVGASIALFENFAAAGGTRMVATGTCAEYAPPDGAPCSETSTPLVPATLYGACKHATRVVFEAFARQMSLSAAWGRIFFPYGPGEPAE